jgi:hypothetical protein
VRLVYRRKPDTADLNFCSSPHHAGVFLSQLESKIE